MIANSIKTAWRNLWYHKEMTSINVAGLSIGMAAAVLISIWVQNEMSFDSYHKDVKNIYRIRSNMAISSNETWLLETSQYILGDHAAQEVPEIEQVTRLFPRSGNDLVIRYDGKLIGEKRSAYIDEHWFNIFMYELVEGSVDSFFRDPFSLAMTASTAEKYFGRQNAIGKTVSIDSVNYRVQAVIKDNPANSSFQYDVLIPISSRSNNADFRNNQMDWGNLDYLTFIKLRPNADPSIVSSKLNKILRKNSNASNNTTFNLVNIKSMHFENDLLNSVFIHADMKTVDIFVLIGLLILITASINYVNLTTASASKRSKEISIRKIIGAARLDLFGQFMFESLFISVFALIIAISLVELSLPAFRAFTGKEYAQPLLSATTWQIMSATLVFSFLLNGLYPAIYLSSFDPLKTFRGKVFRNFKLTALRTWLVVSQFSISIVLIIAMLVIYRQLNYIRDIDLGYNRAHVLTIDVPVKLFDVDRKRREAMLNAIKLMLKAQSGVSDVSLASSGFVDFKNQSSGSFDWTDRSPNFNPYLAPLQADHDFQHVVGIKIDQGRWFSTERFDRKNVLLNETAVKSLRLKEPVVGQPFIHQGDTGVIIGVVKDFHFKSLHDKIGPMVIADIPGKVNCIYVKMIPGATTEVIHSAQTVWQQFFPDDPFAYNFLDASYNSLYKAEQQIATLITLFAGISVFVSALGVLGLSLFAAEQKVKEIGIRKILGASSNSIIALLSKDFIKILILSSAAAFPIAWWSISKWLRNFAYRIDISWWIFLLAAGIALLIVAITVGIQSIKVALANPVTSLRSE